MRNTRKTVVISLLSMLIFASIGPFYLANARRSFTIDTFVLADEGGSISPPGPISVDNNRDQSFSILPDLGYHLQTLEVDDVEQPVVPSGVIYTFTRVKTDHKIEAVFAANAAVGLPEGSDAVVELTVWDNNYFNPLLPGIDGITPYFEFEYVEGTLLAGDIHIQVDYDDTGLSLAEEQSLRLYIGNPVDFDEDGTVNGNDINRIIQEAKSEYPDFDMFDLNNDNAVDDFDIRIVKEYANSGLIVNPGQDGAGEFRIPWLDITSGEVDTVNNIIYGVTWHLSLFRCR
jgi:hypothetical protein